MSPALPQELIDHIVDAVHTDVHLRNRRRWRDILTLLRAARCFGARCRKYLYHTVSIHLEITPPSDLDKTLDVSSLCFVELVRHTPSLAGLVKNVYYGLYFEPHDVSSITFTSTTAWHMLREIAPYLTRLDVVTLSGYGFEEKSFEGFHMLLNSQVVKAIGQIIPPCPFPKLSLESMALLPIHVVDLLAYCPRVISLDINEVSLGFDALRDRNTVRPAVTSAIEELVVAEADSFLFEMTRHDACRTLFAFTRRLVFAGFDSSSTSADLWAALGEFIPRFRTLEKVFFQLSFHKDIDFNVHALLHAPFLCLEMFDTANLLALSSALMQSPGYPSKLRRVAIIVHTSHGQSIDEWRELASALHLPRFVALETVSITFSRRSSENTPYTIEDVSRCFAEFKAKVNVRELALQPAVYEYFDTLF